MYTCSLELPLLRTHVHELPSPSVKIGWGVRRRVGEKVSVYISKTRDIVELTRAAELGVRILEACTSLIAKP